MSCVEHVVKIIKWCTLCDELKGFTGTRIIAVLLWSVKLGYSMRLLRLCLNFLRFLRMFYSTYHWVILTSFSDDSIHQLTILTIDANSQLSYWPISFKLFVYKYAIYVEFCMTNLQVWKKLIGSFYNILIYSFIQIKYLKISHIYKAFDC